MDIGQFVLVYSATKRCVSEGEPFDHLGFTPDFPTYLNFVLSMDNMTLFNGVLYYAGRVRLSVTSRKGNHV